MAEFCASTGTEIYCKKSHQDVQLDLRSKCANQAVTQQRRCQKDQEIEGNALLRCLHSQFARVVKGVDLRSTAGNCAWVRTPQLTIFVCISFSLSFFLLSSSVRHLCLSPSPPVSLSYDLKLETLRNMVCAKKLEHLTVADFLRCCISWVKSDMIEELALTLILTLIPTSNILRLMFQ